jgi:exosortase A-associated hydrolase 1
MIHVDAFTFPCEGEELLGILHRPARPFPIALLILVGGPQYRVGAHRQYVHLARAAADNGIPAMRFDYRGVGDSSGEYPGFERVAPDIAAAVAALYERLPKLQGVVLWGLCEGASAILLGGTDVVGVKGAVLVNPWVHTEESAANTMLKHYYGGRLLDKAAWARVFKGEVNILQSVKSVLGLLKRKLWPQRTRVDNRPYPDRMADGAKRFTGRLMLLMSERDLVAREFEDVTAASPAWKDVLQNCGAARCDVADSDHTFSSEAWRRAAADATIKFIRSFEVEEQD